MNHQTLVDIFVSQKLCCAALIATTLFHHLVVHNAWVELRAWDTTVASSSLFLMYPTVPTTVEGERWPKSDTVLGSLTTKLQWLLSTISPSALSHLFLLRSMTAHSSQSDHHKVHKQKIHLSQYCGVHELAGRSSFLAGRRPPLFGHSSYHTIRCVTEPSERSSDFIW